MRYQEVSQRSTRRLWIRGSAEYSLGSGLFVRPSLQGEPANWPVSDSCLALFLPALPTDTGHSGLDDLLTNVGYSLLAYVDLLRHSRDAACLFVYLFYLI